jgi:thioredoxin 1
MCALAAGCGGEKVRQILNEADFNRTVLQSAQPVLVDFYKGGGCPPCKMVLPALDELAEEYKGRVLVTKFELISMWFEVQSERLKAQYDIFYIPTVILFVDGKERKRWPLIFLTSEYRKVLDEVLAERAAQQARGAAPAAAPVSAPAAAAIRAPTAAPAAR